MIWHVDEVKISPYSPVLRLYGDFITNYKYHVLNPDGTKNIVQLANPNANLVDMIGLPQIIYTCLVTEVTTDKLKILNVNKKIYNKIKDLPYTTQDIQIQSVRPKMPSPLSVDYEVHLIDRNK